MKQRIHHSGIIILRSVIDLGWCYGAARAAPAVAAAATAWGHSPRCTPFINRERYTRYMYKSTVDVHHAVYNDPTKPQ